MESPPEKDACAWSWLVVHKAPAKVSHSMSISTHSISAASSIGQEISEVFDFVGFLEFYAFFEYVQSSCGLDTDADSLATSRRSAALEAASRASLQVTEGHHALDNQDLVARRSLFQP